MKDRFITEKQSRDVDFIADIIKPILGKIHNIQTCMAEACNSYAYLVNGNFIVKFAKDDEKLKKLLLERDVLSLLKGKTTLKIPEFNIFKNIFTFSIHEIIKGETFLNRHYQCLSDIDKDKFCQDIALFMYELHLETHRMKNLNIPTLKGVTGIYPIEKIKTFFTSYANISPDEKRLIRNFCDKYTNTDKRSIRVFGHFDIQPKNIAFDFVQSKINGIFDFGDCGFCNPAYDFTQFAIRYKPEIIHNVLKYYKMISGIDFNLEQILKDSLYRILYCLMRDIEANRPINKGLETLREKIYS